MSDVISREDVLKAVWNESWQETYDIIRALPATQPDPREAALRDAAKVLADRADYLEDAVKWGGSKQYLAGLKGGAIELRHARNSILALTNKPAVQLAHVNETPKSEHEDADMLTPAKGGDA